MAQCHGMSILRSLQWWTTSWFHSPSSQQLLWFRWPCLGTALPQHPIGMTSCDLTWDEDILLVVYSCIFYVSDRRLITNQSNLWIWSTLRGTSWPYLHFNKCRRHIHPRKAPTFCKLVKHDKFNTHTHNGPPEDNACDSQFSKAFTQRTLVLKGSVTSSDKWFARWLLVVSMGVSLRLRHLGTGKGRHSTPQLSLRISHYGQKALVCSMRLVARQLAWGPPKCFGLGSWW